jgi:hypothetical protein
MSFRICSGMAGLFGGRLVSDLDNCASVVFGFAFAVAFALALATGFALGFAFAVGFFAFEPTLVGVAFFAVAFFVAVFFVVPTLVGLPALAGVFFVAMIILLVCFRSVASQHCGCLFTQSN